MHQNKDIWDFKSGKVILQNDVHYEIIQKLFQYLDFKTTPLVMQNSIWLKIKNGVPMNIMKIYHN